MKKPLDLAIADQLEALAIAVAMALVLKFFLVEAYQIPSGSMQPTILGDPGTGIFDRVLADKLTTMIRPPRRWEVMIFRFPNDERALYVKRIVGLPGETLEIRGGDLWVDGRIARKPDAVLDSVLKDVYRRGDEGVDLGLLCDAGPGITLRGERADFSPDTSSSLELRSSVRDGYLHGYDPGWGIQPNDQDKLVHAVADLELSFDVTLASGGRVQLAIDSDEGLARFELSAGGEATADFTPAGTEAPVVAGRGTAGSLPAGEARRVVARHVDHELALFVDGDEVLRVPDDVSPARAARPRRALVRLGLQGGGSLSGLRVRRDIFYTPPREGEAPRWEIPAGHYFALGDNTQGSLDGRGWRQLTLIFKPGAVKTADGRPVTSWTGFDFDNPRAPDANPRRLGAGRLAFANLHGDVVHFRESDIVSESREPAPFIPSRCLLGKAVAVFWPVFDPFRWKLIR